LILRQLRRANPKSSTIPRGERREKTPSGQRWCFRDEAPDERGSFVGVSTACESARTEFFDPQFVTLVADDPHAVAAGVCELAAPRLNPEKVRAFAFERLRAMRQRYAEYIAGIAGTRVEEAHSHLFDGSLHRLAYSAQ
jgi:hypothetical protein